MNGIQNRKAADTKKPFPGCLGRMVNLFDLSTGAPGNRLLTEKPHRDGSALSRSRSDGARTSPIGDPIDDKAIVPELRRTSNKKSNGMPMKMLIAQEMSREVEFKHNTASPSVVAKLMGLDALPRQHSDSAEQRSHSRSHSGIPLGSWQREHGFDMEMQHEINQFPEQIEYKDVHEVWQQSQKSSYGRDKSPLKGRHIDNTHDRKMALVRQKFTEAKRLATDEKLRQSKQFQDALEVLSSNKDLLVKFLQEPNPLFSQHLYDLLSTPASPETKRITVLRPSKMVDNNKIFGMDKKIEKQTQRTSHMDEVTGWDKGNLAFSPRGVDDNPIQPTRIVVLKPNSGKPHDIKAVVSPHSSPPRVLHGEEFCGEPEDDEVQESREVPQEITWQIRENLSGHQRDETLLSSEFSNGYIGDESSFNKSENEYVPGNPSDYSEVISPTSRHSWDYVNKFDSPYSSSSFSHASYSPESSVCREAKKRLSERWAMVASNGNSLEPRHVRRSSSTLGEMLALSDTRNFARSEGDGINTEQEPQGSTSYSAGNLHKDDSVDNSPRNLSRSKSIPVSSTGSGGRLNIEVSQTEFGKIDIPKEVAKVQAVKSFKGKVSSLFFSRNKKSSKDRSSASQSKYESQNSSGTRISSSEKSSNGTSQCAENNGIEEGLLPTLQVSSSKTPSPDLIGLERKQEIIPAKPGLSVTKPVVRGNPSENQDQPSPISVLEPSFEEDENVTAESCHVNPDKHEQTGAKLPAHSLKPNLIDKSPPIESIARTLSWDDSCAETATSYPLRPSVISPGTREEEGEWLFLIQSLLSAAGLDGEVQADSYFAKWHSPESPLDPLLRDKYADPDNEELIIHEAKRRQRRSRRRLVFDCVNAALIEITGYGLTTIDTGGVHKRRLADGTAQPMLMDELWGRMKEWFAWEVNCFPGDGGGCGGDGSNSLVVERVVRREVVGKGWAEHMRMERVHIGKEIQGKLLDDLVQEAVVELTGNKIRRNQTIGARDFQVSVGRWKVEG
ncbi:uncharacterized protein LOC127787049 isoform X2 [Diospyros lotus]|uniref:uncharacterized protein LOC127787049 isoform X2 n=1 Tax=Diospyros lotus TaxID=55363 RepID=UPI00224DA3EC|nr:uncharacterized protein LOC127787049 isoform X2 [Diospyros lotus]